MNDTTPLWLVILGALGIVAALVVRRMSQLAARTRELERFQRAATQLDLELAATTGPILDALDEIRRHGGDPGALSDALPATSDALHRCMADARALRPPSMLAEHAAALGRELEHAVRALQRVEHGLDSMRAGRGPRELEAQTSLKRGALDLRHARDAFTDVVKVVVAVDPASLATKAVGRPAPPPPGVPTYLVEGVDPEPDVAFDPRM